MKTSAIIMMVTVMGLVTLITGYFIYRVLASGANQSASNETGK